MFWKTVNFPYTGCEKLIPAGRNKFIKFGTIP